MATRFKPGDGVLYRKQKFSAHPGPGATEIHPAPYGEFYSYEVIKFWTVVAVNPNNEIVVCTRRGKQLTVPAHDPALRRANWLQRLFFRHRFPVLKPADSDSGQTPSPAGTTGNGHPN
jgi:hypothetical protein